MFALKFIRGKIPTSWYLRNIEIEITSDFPFCQNKLEDIDHLLLAVTLSKKCNIIAECCPIPNRTNSIS